MTTTPQDRFLSRVETHRGAILKICWAYGRTDHDRADLFQDIVARLWTSFHTYDDRRPFITWMYRVALNVAIDFHRQRRRWNRVTTTVDDGLDECPGEPADDPSHRDQLRDLRELLDRVSDQDRPLVLLYLEGHSHREIGEVLGVSESNVGTRLHRLTKTLRRAAQDTPPGDPK